MVIHVLGISGTPRQQGATNVLVQAALLGAQSVEGVTADYVPLAGKSITPCNGCEPCLQAAASDLLKPEHEGDMAKSYCVIDDDMQPLYEKLLSADAIILGTPVYFGSPSALCKAFMERVEGFGVHEKKLRLKVGGAIATAASRNGGQETALLTINLWCHINDMLPVGITAPGSQWGATGNTAFDPDDVHQDAFELKLVKRKVLAKEGAWLYGRKIATVAKIVKAGIQASGLDLPDRPYGFDLPEEFPASLYQIR